MLHKFETFDTVIGSDKFRVSTLQAGEKTAGWVVRRACNAYFAYRPSRYRPPDGVVNLLTDGELVGQFSSDYEAKAALLDDVGITSELVTDMRPGNIAYFNLDRVDPATV